MNTQHTPGRWILSDETNPLIFANGAYVAQVLMYSDGQTGSLRDRAHADARLIAAAPDLLLALEYLLGDLELDMKTDGPATHRLVKSGKRIEHARAAIAKATGGDA
jgi:hypothetical protein